MHAANMDAYDGLDTRCEIAAGVAEAMTDAAALAKAPLLMRPRSVAQRRRIQELRC